MCFGILILKILLFYSNSLRLKIIPIENIASFSNIKQLVVINMRIKESHKFETFKKSIFFFHIFPNRMNFRIKTKEI